MQTTRSVTTETPRATRELSQVIEDLIGSSAVSAQPTLSEVRAVVLRDGVFVSGEGEFLFPQDRTFLVIELDELIDCHGMEAAARSFTGDALA